MTAKAMGHVCRWPMTSRFVGAVVLLEVVVKVAL